MLKTAAQSAEQAAGLPPAGASHLTPTEAAHAWRVSRVSARIRQRRPGQIIRILKRGSHSIHAAANKAGAQLINIEQFDQILRLDPERLTVTAESHVTM